MQVRHIPMVEAKTNLSRLVEDVANNGDIILITRNGRPIAQLSLPPETPALQPIAPLGSRIYVGGLRRFFDLTNESAIVALEAMNDQRQGSIITVPQPNGAAAFIPVDAIEFVEVPVDAAAKLRTIPAAEVPDLFNPGEPIGEIVTTSDTRFRVTKLTAELMASHLGAGTKIVGFRAIDPRQNNYVDKVIYITRGHVNYVLANRETASTHVA